MAETPSAMIPLGTRAPEFSLRDTLSGDRISLSDRRGEKATVIMFICNHCPFVLHVAVQLPRLAEDYKGKGISFISISSNDVKAYPQDSPEKMREFGLANGFPFPYLYDEDQTVARSYSAACTPDFFIFDRSLALVYRGQLDDSRPGNHVPVTGKDIREALDNILEGKPVNPVQYPSIGCNIKWKGSSI